MSAVVSAGESPKLRRNTVIQHVPDVALYADQNSANNDEGLMFILSPVDGERCQRPQSVLVMKLSERC
jgi:hypothetical protein